MDPNAQAQVYTALIANAPTIITAVVGGITTLIAFVVGLNKPQPVKKAKAKDGDK